MEKKIKVFVSYSHKDKWIYENDSFLSIIISYFEEKVEFWFDPRLAEKVGKKYKPLIERQIQESDFALLLLSNQFKASSFIKRVELPLIKKLYTLNGIELIPILISPVNLSDNSQFDWIEETQILPSNNSPLSEYIDNIDKWEKVKTSIFNSLDKRFKEFSENRQNYSELEESVVSEKNNNNSTKAKDGNKDEFITNIDKYLENNTKSSQERNSKKKNALLLKILIVLVTILSVSLICYLIFFHNLRTKNEHIMLNQTPITDSLGGDVKIDTISGEVNIESSEKYKIIIYAYTDMWYIQPSTINPKINIIGGKWKTATHLGKKYGVMLVKDTFQPKNKIQNLPQIDREIIEIKLIH